MLSFKGYYNNKALLQVQTTQGDWEAERQDRLQADRDRERAKQIILKLQEENWRLRKSRTVSHFHINTARYR